MIFLLKCTYYACFARSILNEPHFPKYIPIYLDHYLIRAYSDVSNDQNIWTHYLRTVLH